MTTYCAAVYQNGVLRPMIAPQLREGEQVQLIIVSAAPTGTVADPADILAAIADLPVQGSGDPFTSRDHDQVL